MKAAVRHEFGGPEVVRLEDVPTPAPGERDILIRVRAASVNLGDWELLTGRPPYITLFAAAFTRKPRYVVPDPPGRRRGPRPKFKILGCDVAGTVEAVGPRVTRFKPGDDVFGECAVAGFGAFAEYVLVPDRSALARKPAGMTFEQAAALPQAAFIAVQAVRDRGRAGPGRRVLVNGAGGGAGTLALQLARVYGAAVDAVDGPGKQDLLRDLGTDLALDYTREDYARTGRRYDLILDLASYRPLREVRRSLAPGGLHLVAGGDWSTFWRAALLGPLRAPFDDRRTALLLAANREENLTHVAELVLAGKLAPVLDRSYPLAETGRALARLGEKRSRGKVVVVP